MSKADLINWLEENQPALVRSFAEAGADSRRFPNLSALSTGDRSAVMGRELTGVIGFVAADEGVLKRSVAVHKHQVTNILEDVPIEEQLAHLEKRAEIVTELFDADPDNEFMRDDLSRALEAGSRYYRMMTRTITASQRLRKS